MDFFLSLRLVLLTALAAGYSSAGDHPTAHFTKRAPLPTGEEITAILHVDGLTAIATSEPKLLLSSDLETFDAIATGLDAGFTDLAFLGGSWFASGEHIYRSSDLSSWESILVAEDENFEFEHVFAAGNDIFATSTKRRYPGSLAELAKLFRSSDGGDSWQEMAGAPPASRYEDVLFAKGRYYLAGLGTPLGNGLWVSDDGAAWEPILPGAYTFYKLREIDGEIFALNSDGEIAISGDGIGWEIAKPESRFDPQFTRKLTDIVKLPTKFLLYSEWDYHDLMWESVDGRSWELIEPTTTAYSEQLELNGLEVVDGVALAFGRDGALRKTTDWDVDLQQILPVFWKDWNAVSASNSTVVVVGDGGQVASSFDTVSWEFQVLEPGFDLGSVIFDQVQDAWFAVGREANGTGKIFSSPDGVTWAEQLASEVGLRGIGSDGDGRVIACGDGGKLLVLEGDVWLEVASGTLEDLYAVAYCDFGWLAVGGGASVLQSDFGSAQWRVVQSDPLATGRYSSIDFGNGLVILGYAGQYDHEVRGRSVSDDLDTWHGVGSHDPGAVVFDGIRFVSAERGISTQGGFWQGAGGDSLSIYWQWSMVDGIKFQDRIVFVGGQGRIAVSDPYTDEISDWLEDKFHDPSQRLIHADPDHDGFSNALEYCLGFDPLGYNANSDAIKIRDLRNADVPNVVAEYPVTSMVDAALAVEWSTDLVEWHRVGGRFEYGYGDDFPMHHRSIELNLPVPTGEVFFRLKCEVAERE